MRPLLVALFIILLIVIIYRGALIGREKQTVSPPGFPHDQFGPLLPLEIDDPKYRIHTKPYDRMTAGERVQYILDTYFSIRDDTNTKEADRDRKEDAYIRSLPLDSSCPDQFSKCPQWAQAGECTVNPEWMLYNCARSCQSCALTTEQKYNVTKIYNQRDPATSVYHGEEYPGDFPYLDYMYNYTHLPTGLSSHSTKDTVPKMLPNPVSSLQ
jgi:hypothetical protein